MTGYVVTRWYRAPEVILNWMHYTQTGKSSGKKRSKLFRSCSPDPDDAAGVLLCASQWTSGRRAASWRRCCWESRCLKETIVSSPVIGSGSSGDLLCLFLLFQVLSSCWEEEYREDLDLLCCLWHENHIWNKLTSVSDSEQNRVILLLHNDP